MSGTNRNTIDPANLAAELRAQMARLKRRLREQADPLELSSSQIAAILRLESHPMTTVSDLARMEGVRPQSMRNTVAGLKESGLVDGENDPNDGRKTYMFLTDDGHRLIHKGRSLWNDWLASEISEKLSQEEQEILGKAVTLIQRLTEG